MKLGFSVTTSGSSYLSTKYRCYSSWFLTFFKMMPSHLIISILTVLLIRGVYLSKEKQVFQTPADLFMKPNVQANLSLTHQIPSYDTILWYQRSAGDTSLKLIGYVSYRNPTIEKAFQSYFNVSGDGEKTVYLHILRPRHPEDSGEYLGAARGTGGFNTEAYFGTGTKLTVLEKDRKPTPPVVKVLPPSKDECRNQKDNEKKKTLVCVAKDFYPDHVSVSWKIENGDDNIGEATDTAALRTGDSYTITSRLRVSAKTWFIPTNVFTCNVTFFDGKKYTHHTDFINGEEAPDTNDMTREKFLKLSQNGKLSYGIFIAKGCVYGAFVAFLVWKLQGSTGK